MEFAHALHFLECVASVPRATAVFWGKWLKGWAKYFYDLGDTSRKPGARDKHAVLDR